MYKLFVKRISSFVIGMAGTFGNFMLIGCTNILWINIVASVGFIMGLIGTVLAYKSVKRIAESMDAIQLIDNSVRQRIVDGFIKLTDAYPIPKDEKKEEEDDEHAYCAGTK